MMNIIFHVCEMKLNFSFVNVRNAFKVEWNKWNKLNYIFKIKYRSNNEIIKIVKINYSINSIVKSSTVKRFQEVLTDNLDF